MCSGSHKRQLKFKAICRLQIPRSPQRRKLLCIPDGRIKAFWNEWEEDEDARVMEDAEQELQGIEDPDTPLLAETYLNFKRMQAGIQ